MGLRHAAGCLLVVCVLAVAAVACDEGANGSPETGPRAEQPSASVPPGWKTARVEGLRVAFPADFEPIPSSGAGAPTRQFGVPYAGQPFPPPLLQVFVERSQVGPLEARVPLTQGQIEAQLGITIEGSEPAQVAGATDAVQFSYEYRTEGGRTTTGDTLKPTTIRQSDLLIDVPGLPKYGLRYGAPADQYDEQTWQRVIHSVTVSPGASTES